MIRIAFCLLLLYSPFIVRGQDTTNVQAQHCINFYVSITGTLTFTNFAGAYIDNLLDNPSNSLAHNNGIMPSVQLKAEFLSEYLYVKSGLSYLQKGAFVYFGGSTTDKLSVYLHYLTIPIAIGFQPINTSNSKRVKFGAEFGILQQFETGGDKNYFKDYPPDDYAFNTSIQSLHYGINFEWKTRNGKRLNLAFSGLTDTRPFFYARNNDDYDIKFKGQGITLGFLIGL